MFDSLKARDTGSHLRSRDARKARHRDRCQHILDVVRAAQRESPLTGITGSGKPPSFARKYDAIPMHKRTLLDAPQRELNQ